VTRLLQEPEVPSIESDSLLHEPEVPSIESDSVVTRA
jgi:hypothetical protein